MTAPAERDAPVPTSCVRTSAVVVDPEPPVGLPQEMAAEEVDPDARACAAGADGGTSGSYSEPPPAETAGMTVDADGMSIRPPGRA
jgi:hypothetical protein